MDENELKKIIEGLLFIWGDPLSIDDIADICGYEKKLIRNLLEEMKDDFLENRGLIIKSYEDKYQLASKSEYFDYYQKLVKKNKKPKLTNSSMETLAIIAYKQPITRIEVDNIRGVKSSSSIQTLIKRDLIKESGKLDAIGKPILYSTTDKFLRYFDISKLKDLPSLDDFNKMEEDYEKQLEMDDYENQ